MSTQSHADADEFPANSLQSNCPDGQQRPIGDPAKTALVALDPFCHRQFDDPKNRRPGEKISMSKDEFMAKIHEEIEALGGSMALVDGYVHT